FGEALAGRLGFRRHSRRRSSRDSVRSGRASGRQRQLRFVQPAKTANPGKPATRAFRQGDRQGPALSGRKLRHLPRSTMPWPLRQERGDRGNKTTNKKGRLNPLGGRPVEMWTRQAP